MKIGGNNFFKPPQGTTFIPPKVGPPNYGLESDLVSLGSSTTAHGKAGVSDAGCSTSGAPGPSVDPSSASLNGVSSGSVMGLSGKVLAEVSKLEAPQADSPDLKDLPFVSVDNPPAPTKTLHSKIYVVDHLPKMEGNHGPDFLWTEDKGSIWMDDSSLNLKAGNSGPPLSKTFEETLADLGKDFKSLAAESVASDQKAMAHLMAGMAKDKAMAAMAKEKAMAALAALSGWGGAAVAGLGSMMGGLVGGMMGGLGAFPPMGSFPSMGNIGIASGKSETASGISQTASGKIGTASGSPLATPKAPVMETQALGGVQDPKTMTPAQRATQVRQAVDVNLAKMGKTAHYKVDKHLFPLLDKVGLDAAEFFTARACWQGVTSKRRHILEKVLDEFPSLPKDQKNVEAAITAAESKGTKISETDRYFLGYFFEHRKEMKTLFRASLNLFEGDKISVFRGQEDDPKWGKDSTKPLGCYSFDPGVSEGWGTNLKRYRVKLSDVWSTSVISQNANQIERELTVYSRGGIRKGEKISGTKVSEEVRKFEKEYSPNDWMRQAEGKPPLKSPPPEASPLKPNLQTFPSPPSQAAASPAHQAPAYGSD